MATMTKAARKQERIQNLTRALTMKIEQATGKTPDPSDVIELLYKWHRAAERLRKRWENECSYEWANTPAYEKATQNAALRLFNAVLAVGLKPYLQTDPRGATLYVDSKHIDDQTYTSALCICLD